MARILFLDDDLARHERFRSLVNGHGHDVVYVETPEQAKQALDLDQFELASLDHDLFGKVYQPSDEKSGFAVAQHIGRMAPDKQPRRVICHSWNEKGATNMQIELTGCNSYIRPFDTPEYWDRVLN